MRRTLRIFARRQLQISVLMAVLGLAALFAGGQTASAACDASNDIIKCGFTSSSNFVSKARGSSELVHIYSAYGLEPAEYDRFVSKSVQGLAYKDNTIRVNGHIVARNVDSIGRNKALQGSSPFTQKISGAGTYYGNTNDKAFASNALPVTVLLDSSGQVQFAVINSCGNPVGAPNYRCNTLHETPVAGHPDTFKFSADVTANSTAKVTKVVYNFGDGTTDTETDPTLVRTHKYARNGTYSASVTVYISLPHAPDVVIKAGGDCIKKVVVNIPPAPVYVCVSLDRTAINNSGYDYKFVVTGKVANGASVASADFDFGNKHVQKGVRANGDTVTTTYAYDSSKKATYAAKATLHINLPGGKTDTVTSSNCAKQVPVNTPFYACNSMSGALLDEAAHKYSFTVVADYNNYVVFKNAAFDFGDGQKATVAKGSDGKTETATHTFQVLKNYTVIATLNFTENKKVVSVDCKVPVTPTSVGTCQTSDSESNPVCNPCKTNPAVAANSPECTLPNTGAGDVIGIAGVVAVLGFFIYRQFIYRKQIAPAGEAAVHGPVPAGHDDNAVAAQVIAHHHPAHRNTKGLDHASYHKPHRFRPRSHQDHHEQ